MTLTTLDRIELFIIELLRQIHYHLWKLFHLELYKNPEKIIPENTWYCYTYTGEKGIKPVYTKVYYPDDWDGREGQWIDLPYYKTKNCPFHKYSVDKRDLCMYNGSDCMMDWCKTCGINEE